jgi:hypothetical protein
MKHYYLPVLLVGLAQPVAAQLNTSNTAADTLGPRPAFRGDLPDSLAALPTPVGTFRVQGQEQPVRPFLTIQDQLRTVAGVQVTPYDGSPGSGNVVRIRGASVLLGRTQPLYVVDGLPALNDELTPSYVLGTTYIPQPFASSNGSVAEQQGEAGANPLQLPPPEAVESIEVLAGPAAVARYGPLGANGVVSIRTRGGHVGQPLRLRYSAYAGVQQVRHRYELLDASEFAAVANESVRNRVGPNATVPYPSGMPLPADTDWQAEAYRVAGLHQHNLSLEGSGAHTSYLISADYRQQSGVLRQSDLHRYGLRAALAHQAGTRLTLRGTLALSQTDQRLPIATVRNAQGEYSTDYSNYNRSVGFTNPLMVLDYTYRMPRTRRLLTQLAADYQVAPHLTVQASANFQRTLLATDGYAPTLLPGATAVTSEQSTTQYYQASQWAGQLALHYQRQLGLHHRVGAEIDYQYQAFDVGASSAVDFRSAYGSSSSSNYYSNTMRVHRPWGRLHYALDSTLEVEAGLSYGHYRASNTTEYYPSAQVRWHLRRAAGPIAALSVWLGAARTGVLLNNYDLFGPVAFAMPSSSYPNFSYRLQEPLRNDQLEVGLRVASRTGRLSGQLVAYQRASYHALINTTVPIPGGTGYTTATFYTDDTVIRNQGLELTAAATWQAGRWQAATHLVASINRNRLRAGDFATQLAPAYDNQPIGTFYGYQQDGLTATGGLRYRTDANGQLSQAVLGGGIPAQLLSLSQQARRARWGIDAQVDALLAYRVLNAQRALLDAPTGTSNSATTVRNRWTPTNRDTNIPAASPTAGLLYTPDYSTVVDRLLESGSNVRLSSLTITYRLRQVATQEISLWAGAQNLFVLTGYRGYDPNVSSGGNAPALAGQDYGAVPVPRTWLLGVRASL